MESRLEKIFSMGINSMSLAVWLGEDRKCSAAVVGLDLLLGLSMVRRCSLNRSFKRRFVSPMYCKLRISGITKISNKKITFQSKIFIVPEEGWFGQPKYSTHIKTFLRCAGFCLYFLHFIYVKPVRSPLIQRTPAGSSFRLLA